ncbi:MAG: phospholipase A [Bacteroidales bacterium]|nr:phospholipase A [Bacteroidales bacterium]
MECSRSHIVAVLCMVFMAMGATTLKADDKPRILSFYNDNYVTTGPSLRSDGVVDVKIQFSLKVYPITINPKWQAFFAYTQTTTWDAYGKSAPFHDNLYMPGIYFEGRMNERNVLVTGLEHRSNGRPYFGNPIAAEGVEDYSRGMNYAFARWIHNFGGNSTLDMTLRAGVGCGIGEYGDYETHEKSLTQDLFLYYIGYLTVGYKYTGAHSYLSVNVSPVLNKSIANVNVRYAYEFGDKWPSPFVQFHYGFDEALCDCIKGGVPPVHLRFGVILNHRCFR